MFIVTVTHAKKFIMLISNEFATLKPRTFEDGEAGVLRDADLDDVAELIADLLLQDARLREAAHQEHVSHICKRNGHG